MKNFSTLSFFYLVIGLFLAENINAQNAGIGTSNPDHKLHIASNTSALLKLDNTTGLNTGVMTEMFLKSGQHYTGAVKTIGTSLVTARMGLFTYAATASSALVERMSIMDNGFVGIGTTSPAALLDVNGRIRIRYAGGNTAGIILTDATGASNRGFVGMFDDNTVGMYGYGGAGWAIKMSTTSGETTFSGNMNVFSSSLRVVNDEYFAANFINNSGQNNPAVLAEADFVAGEGVGVEANGGEIGVYANAIMPGGNSHHYGVEAYASNAPGNNYGVYASANGGNNAYGIFAKSQNGTTNWGGYFTGSVYTTGSYQGSDRKLKSNIQDIDHATQLIKKLKPSTYLYKTDEYNQMELPEGQQYGLIADEVKEVFPSMVKAAVQPAQYENNDRKNGRMISDEVSFEAVNYTALIPVLIAAMQEQQATIEMLQQKVQALEAK